MLTYQKYYYKGISALLPNFFFILVMWTCYDIFLTAIIMIIFFYYVITLYYFQIEDDELNEVIRSKVEELIYSSDKVLNILKGFFVGCLLMLPLLYSILNSDNLPVVLPMPDGK